MRIKLALASTAAAVGCLAIGGVAMASAGQADPAPRQLSCAEAPSLTEVQGPPVAPNAPVAPNSQLGTAAEVGPGQTCAIGAGGDTGTLPGIK